MSKLLRIIVLILAILLIAIGVTASVSKKPVMQMMTEAKLHIFGSTEIKQSPEPQNKRTETPEFIPKIKRYVHIVQRGDSLTRIVWPKKKDGEPENKDSIDLKREDMIQLLEADGSYLELDNIKEDDILAFWIDPATNNLLEMRKYLNLAEYVQYLRNEDDSFNYNRVNTDGVWKEFRIAGTIKSGEIFGRLVNNLGVSNNEIGNIAELISNKLNFTSLYPGDRFQILRRAQFVQDEFSEDDETTEELIESGKRSIEAVRFYNRGRVVTAYKHTDGHYYDRDGRGLQRAFRLWPVDEKYRRLTSRFNPNRKHPVTGRVTAHNGEDIGTPTGTNVYAAGDGEVVMTRNHPIAGKYITIRHDDKYVTRYLHLSQILVRKGQKVSVGDVIAKSGATGRITGPHLHYEFIVNGRPRSFLKVDMPTSTGLTGDDKAKFLEHVADVDSRLDDENYTESVIEIKPEAEEEEVAATE